MSTLNVYLYKYSTLSSDKLHTASHDELCQGLLVTPHDFSTQNGYALVGEAEVKFTIYSPAQVLANQVGALRAEQVSIRADAELKATRIEQQIQKLLCIENSTEVA